MRRDFDFNLLRAIEVFLAVVETRQVTKAAQLLGITQSAVSQQLGNLEAAFGTRFIDRQSRPIELTKAGITFHRRATGILNEVEMLRSEIRRIRDAPLPILNIGLLASVSTTLTPTLIRFLKDQGHAAEVSIRAGLASDHQDLLMSRRADIVITSDAFYDVDGLERHHLVKEPFYLVLPPGGRAPASDLPRLFQEQPFIRFSAATPVGRRIDQHLRRLGLSVRKQIEADRSSLVMAAVAAGQGFALMSPTLLLDGIAEGLEVVIRPFPGRGFTRTISLVSRADELGELPTNLAAHLRTALLASFAERLGTRLPDGGAGITTFDEP